MNISVSMGAGESCAALVPSRSLGGTASAAGAGASAVVAVAVIVVGAASAAAAAEAKSVGVEVEGIESADSRPELVAGKCEAGGVDVRGSAAVGGGGGRGGG